MLISALNEVAALIAPIVAAHVFGALMLRRLGHRYQKTCYQRLRANVTFEERREEDKDFDISFALIALPILGSHFYAMHLIIEARF